MKIGHAIRRLRREAPSWKVTALAQVAAQWHDPFRVLIACLLSLRTKDETTGPAAARLFALADTPEALRGRRPRALARALYPVGFYRPPARVRRAGCRVRLATRRWGPRWRSPRRAARATLSSRRRRRSRGCPRR